MGTGREEQEGSLNCTFIVDGGKDGKGEREEREGEITEQRQNELF